MPTEKEMLNVAHPGAQRIALGDRLDAIITLLNELRTTATENRVAILELIDDHASSIAIEAELKADVIAIGAAVDGVLTKMDSDGGITDTNYMATHGTGGSGDAIPADVSAAPAATLTASDPTAVSAAAVTALDA